MSVIISAYGDEYIIFFFILSRLLPCSGQEEMNQLSKELFCLTKIAQSLSLLSTSSMGLASFFSFFFNEYIKPVSFFFSSGGFPNIMVAVSVSLFLVSFFFFF